MKLFLVAVFVFSAMTTFSQPAIIKKIKETVGQDASEANVRFLAADELRGRGTGTPEIAIAASYIATQFRMVGVKPAPGTATYYQEVGLQQTFSPSLIELTIGTDTFSFRRDLILLKGKGISGKVELIFVDYGSADQLTSEQIKGKVVVAYAGSSSTSTMREAFLAEAPRKYATARDHGALALIEIAGFTDYPWQRIVDRFSGGKTALSGDNFKPDEMPHLWMAQSQAESITKLIQSKRAEGSLSVTVKSPRQVPGRNVVGWIEGTDTQMRQEYVVLSAHYDHMGVMKNESPDSIYNGARDNAIGTAAVLEAARYFSKNPPKRSLLFIAFCAEEQGLLGSRWYANHPMIPLEKTVFNLDCDGAGYNDKTLSNVVDLSRTTADPLLIRAYAAFGLTLKGDPAPGMNLYERSDNYNFAVKGVPAVDISPGVKALDDEIMRYYHQPADEAQTLDFEYLTTFFRAYVYSASLVANAAERPTWKAGDKFEGAGKLLYGKR